MGSKRQERILETTRGRVAALLRRGGMTTDEIAHALGLTDNAIRAHLATLERDGIVRAHGERREGRVGKPATIYHIVPEAEPLFSRAYLPLLTSLLAALGERLSREELDDLLANVGSRLASDIRQPSGSLRQRAEAASETLNQLGGLSEVREVDDGAGYLIQSHGCPLGAAVNTRPEVCEAVVSLISQMTGAEVRSRCQRSGRPSCCFELRPAGTA